MTFNTLPQLWPLQSGSTNAPTLTAGAQLTFQHQDLPDRSPTGPLAYYLLGDIVTFSGTVVTAGGAGSIIFSDQFYSALFTSLGWIQAWHGTVVSPQHVLGAQWHVIEYMLGGQRYAAPVQQRITLAAANTYNFELQVFVPFSSCRLGDLEHQTSQLALLARASQLQINAAPAATLAALSTGSTFGTITVRASAVLAPRQELVLGTPIETILTQVVAGSGNAVKITNFGTDTGLQGVDPGGGVLGLLFLTSALSQGGSFASVNITDLTWPWRGQPFTQDVFALLSSWKRQLKTLYPSNFSPVVAGSTSLQGVPYTIGNSTQNNPSTAATNELRNLLFWALVLADDRPRLTSLQTADNDQTFNLTVTGGYSGTHQILGFYARSWQDRMRQNWLAQVMAGGDGSLARHVLGPNYGSFKMARRGPSGKHFTTVDEARYLPWGLFPPQLVG